MDTTVDADPPIPPLQTRTPAAVRTRLIVISCALFAMALKIAIALQTVGTNDTLTFYKFGRMLTVQGLEWTYANEISFNHPPLTAYFLKGIFWLDHALRLRHIGLEFPFLLRLPGIIADLVAVIIVLRISETARKIPTWALVIFALSPVSLMISGFHGNTDSVMAMFLVIAGFMCVRQRPVLCALFMALSCQVKIVPLLLVPIVFFFWAARGSAVRFAVPFIIVSVIGWIQPLIHFPALLIKNVLSYGSFWGLWGISYWLRQTGLPMFGSVTYYNLPPMEAAVGTFLKGIIIVAVLALAWRRRGVEPIRAFDSLGYAWLVFFAISPGVCAQYLVWLAPFVLVLAPNLYAWITAASALFLFEFYNITADKWPWYLAVSSRELNTVWTPWAMFPWAAILVALVVLYRRSSRDPAFRLVSLRSVQ